MRKILPTLILFLFLFSGCQQQAAEDCILIVTAEPWVQLESTSYVRPKYEFQYDVVVGAEYSLPDSEGAATVPFKITRISDDGITIKLSSELVSNTQMETWKPSKKLEIHYGEPLELTTLMTDCGVYYTFKLAILHYCLTYTFIPPTQGGIAFF